MVNGKSKGNAFERSISKKLSLWLSDDSDDHLFWRTESSGGRFTQRKKLGKNTDNQEGDITSVRESSKCVSDLIAFECKFHKNIDFFNMILGRGIVFEWYKKLREDCGNKYPCLIIKQNYKDTLFICGRNFDMDFGVKPSCNIYLDQDRLSIFLFEDFLKTVNGSWFLQRVNKILQEKEKKNGKSF